VNTRTRPLPEPAVRAALAAIVDWSAVTVAGAVAEPAERLRRALLPAAGPCRLPGTAATAGAETAALINGTAAHTPELDDIYAPRLFHPGAPTVAAAFAAAERRPGVNAVGQGRTILATCVSAKSPSPSRSVETLRWRHFSSC
jgi:2-methylcitrate dehydratase PrpD